MKNPDPDTVVRRFIDGDLSEDEVREALHRIADDPEARSLLQFELQMTQDLAASRSSQPSPGFASRTVEQLAEADATAPSLGSRLRAWWQAVTRPLITVPVRPAHALAVVLLVGVAVWLTDLSTPSDRATAVSEQSNVTSSVQTTTTSARQQAETVWTRFVYTDNEADSVAVAGDFSQWEPIPLTPHPVEGTTVWTGLVPVSRGEHEYQFVINGEKWVTDPLAPVKQDDGFGAKNAVLKL